MSNLHLLISVIGCAVLVASMGTLPPRRHFETDSVDGPRWTVIRLLATLREGFKATPLYIFVTGLVEALQRPK